MITRLGLEVVGPVLGGIRAVTSAQSPATAFREQGDRQEGGITLRPLPPGTGVHCLFAGPQDTRTRASPHSPYICLVSYVLLKRTLIKIQGEKRKTPANRRHRQRNAASNAEPKTRMRIRSHSSGVPPFSRMSGVPLFQASATSLEVSRPSIIPNAPSSPPSGEGPDRQSARPHGLAPDHSQVRVTVGWAKRFSASVTALLWPSREARPRIGT